MCIWVAFRRFITSFAPKALALGLVALLLAVSACGGKASALTGPSGLPATTGASFRYVPQGLCPAYDIQVYPGLISDISWAPFGLNPTPMMSKLEGSYTFEYNAAVVPVNRKLGISASDSCISGAAKVTARGLQILTQSGWKDFPPAGTGYFQIDPAGNVTIFAQ